MIKNKFSGLDEQSEETHIAPSWRKNCDGDASNDEEIHGVVKMINKINKLGAGKQWY